MQDRIKKLRKALNLNQTEFGEKIGAKQATVAGWEVGRREPSPLVIGSICREFGVNEDWLRSGEGEMFAKQATFSLDEFVKERGGSDLEIEFLKIYFELDKGIRRQLVDHFVSHFTNLNKTTAAEPDPEDVSTEVEEAAYRKALGIAENTGSSALNTTEGTGDKASNQ